MKGSKQSIENDDELQLLKNKIDKVFESYFKTSTLLKSIILCILLLHNTFACYFKTSTLLNGVFTDINMQKNLGYFWEKLKNVSKV